jgi:hypothetical protein
MFYVALFLSCSCMLFIRCLIEKTFSLQNSQIIGCVIFILTTHYFYILTIYNFIEHCNSIDSEVFNI